MRPGLLVIDAQNGWLEMSEGLKLSVQKTIPHIVEAIQVFRRAGAPILFTYHLYKEKGLYPGSKDFNLFPEIEIMPEDKWIIKTYQNAFNKTELGSLLKEQGCDTVVLAGLSAMNCVLTTYYGAYDVDLSPYLLRGAVAGPDQTSIDLVEKICDTLSIRAVNQILGGDQSVMVGHGVSKK